MIRTVVLGLLFACGANDRQTTPLSGSGGSDPAPIISEKIRKLVCNTEPCGGDMSILYVYRDAGGAVKKLYRLYGPCSHNAGIYFDPDGTQTEAIAERPIQPGSDEAREVTAQHDKQVGGLTKTDVISCRTGARSNP